jgi:hypothetical protein
MAVKGGHLTDAHRLALRTANIGRKRITSERTKIKISLATKGKKVSDDTKAKLSAVRIGIIFSAEHRENLSNAHTGIRLPPFSPEHRKKISIALKGKYCGELATNWQGGISFEPYCPKFNNDLKLRVRSFFNYQCIICGKHESNCKTKHCVHHVSYDKMICCNGKPVQFAALCRSCHNRTNFDRDRWQSIIHRIIDELYSGRSYFTKEEWKEIQSSTQNCATS